MKGGMRFEIEPIGIVRSPFKERVDAPRQAPVASDVAGRVELFAGRMLEDALQDLALWDHLWLISWFHHNTGFRPKVQPPRSAVKRGVLATRAPYRPNPIGLTAVRLERVEGLVLHVRGLDLLDGTPVLDIKPYVPYSDALPDANHGWLDQEASAQARPADPLPAYAVEFSDHAQAQLSYLHAAHGIELVERIASALALGPSPHAYRRIRRERDDYVLSVRDFRVVFVDTGGRVLKVKALRSGYKARELHAAEGDAPAAHRAFVSRYGLGGSGEG
jgi:tRNA-Thr(GGU) m(6)t(6)A37 methyltransferase TsaA